MLSRFRNSIRYNWFAYVWLIYLPNALTDYLPPHTLNDWLWLGLAGCFLVTYFLTSSSQRFQKVSIIIQMVIVTIFAFFDQNVWLMVYPGWQVSSFYAYAPKKYFRIFAIIYYTILGISLGILNQIHPGFFMRPDNWASLVFIIGSPFISYYFTSSIKHGIEMAATNKRLESVVRRGERERIARDLHDTLGQSFSMITVKTELAKKLLEKKPEKVPAELDDIATTSRENLQVVRNIVNNLRQETIAEAMLKQQENLREAEINLVTDGEQNANEWPTTIQVKFTPILQEAVTNVIRHSHANTVTISFKEADQNYQMIVQDNGRGAKQFKRDGSNGVPGMAERLRTSGGHFKIATTAAGTAVTASIPKEVIA